MVESIAEKPWIRSLTI